MYIKRINNLRLLVVALVAAVVGMSYATAVKEYYYTPQDNSILQDSIVLSYDEEKPVLQNKVDTGTYVEPHRFFLNTLMRGYDDKIVLRWMPDEYVPFIFGTKYGYSVVRIDEQLNIDTLAACLKPLTVEQLIEKYGANDTIAAAAAQAIYGRSVSLNQTEAPPGSAGSILEVYEQQQDLFGFAALIADMRPDLAEDMALKYTDRTAQPGKKYQYLVRSLAPDSLCLMGYVDNFEWTSLGSYKPSKLKIEITDSITPPDRVMIEWPQTLYSTYRVERRNAEGGKWQVLTDAPYISLQQQDDDDAPNYYLDHDVKPGTYEYRISAMDLFGDASEPSDPHTVVMPDVIPPSAPYLYHIDILRGDSIIQARLQWEKDTIEADLHGFVPMYNLQRLMGDQWIPLTENVLPADTREYTVNVTGLPTGNICIAALDSVGNISYSMTHEIRIADINPPKKPQNLHYTTEIVKLPEGNDIDSEGKETAAGVVTLEWDPTGDRDINYYEVAFANDTTHMFLMASNLEPLRDCIFKDTMAIDLNQKYIYYKVRATDFSTNVGEWSDVIQVVRPSLVTPSVAHLEEATQDQDGLHQTWIAGAEVQIAKHHIYRREEGKKNWTLLAVCNGDSVKAADYRIRINDLPPMSKNRWEYAIETFADNGLSSGLSLIYSARYNGYRKIKCPVKLFGDCVEGNSNETKLAWEVTGKLPETDDWYYCIYRKGPKDADFKYVINVKKDEQTYSDFLIKKGESAQYYVMIHIPGVGDSENSNVITVTKK